MFSLWLLFNFIAERHSLWRGTRTAPKAMNTNGNMGTPWGSEEPYFAQKGTQPLEEGTSEAQDLKPWRSCQLAWTRLEKPDSTDLL